MNKIKSVGLVGLVTSLLFCAIVSPVMAGEKQKGRVVTIEQWVEEHGTESYFTTATSSLNVRKQADLEAEIITSLPYGTEVEFLTKTPWDGWSAIWYNGSINYVYDEFLTNEKVAETVNEQQEVIVIEEESVPEVVIVPQEEEVYVEPEPEPIVEEPAAEPAPSSSGTYLGSYCITHYCNCSACCGQWAGGSTASGAYPTSWHTIATGSEFAFGTQLMINGTIYTVEDRGVGNGCIDIYCDSHDEALSRGMFYADVYLVG